MSVIHNNYKKEIDIFWKIIEGFGSTIRYIFQTFSFVKMTWKKYKYIYKNAKNK